MARLEFLETLWGMDARLGGRPAVGGEAVIRRPWGFKVFEVGPRPVGDPGWSLYLARVVGLDSRRAARLLARLVGAREASYAGLKDACAVKYQYVSVKTSGGPAVVRDPQGLLKAWLVGNGRVAPGLHSGNIFRLAVEHGSPGRLCDALKGLKRFPGYFGPQRFGVERPNTHYMGLLLSLGLWGSLIRELAYRYPLEERTRPGAYERAVIDEARLAASPWAPSSRKAWWVDFALQALRAYLFNKALSKAIASGNIEGYAEHWVEVRCPMGGPLRVPAARLPGRYHLSSGSPWAELVREVVEEEGLTSVLRMWRRVFRPLVYPVCRVWCKPAGGSLEVILALPPGAYATVALWEVVEMDWIGYAACQLRGGRPIKP
jgi:tRNA pseudouridine13 synthase